MLKLLQKTSLSGELKVKQTSTELKQEKQLLLCRLNVLYVFVFVSTRDNQPTASLKTPHEPAESVQKISSFAPLISVDLYVKMSRATLETVPLLTAGEVSWDRSDTGVRSEEGTAVREESPRELCSSRSQPAGGKHTEI